MSLSLLWYFLAIALRAFFALTRSALVNMRRARLVELEQLQHTGIGNPPVHFVMRGVTHQRPVQRMGSERRHARMRLAHGGATCEAVLWNVGDGPLPVGCFDLAFSPYVNRYNGATSVQLKILDWQAVGTPGGSCHG